MMVDYLSLKYKEMNEARDGYLRAREAYNAQKD